MTTTEIPKRRRGRKQDFDIAPPICFYCRMPAVALEYDHFPIPVEVGGTEVVPACLNCHDLKDRWLFGSWPSNETAHALLELQRDRTAFACLEMWGQWEDEPHALPSRWDEYSSLARVAWAKLLRRILVAEHRGEPRGRPSEWIENAPSSWPLHLPEVAGELWSK